MSNHIEIYNKLADVPENALKQIQAGRLKGKSDINPQWRIEALTEQFGMCGFGWRYEITNIEYKQASDNQIACFVHINLFVKIDDEWSEPIVGVGGSMYIANEKYGLYTSDECEKMALTDAISVAGKAIGLAADVYRGKRNAPADKTKYTNAPASPTQSNDDKKWLNATDKAGKLNSTGEKTAHKLASGETTWQKIEAVCKVSKKDREAVQQRASMLIEELNNNTKPLF